MQENRNGISPHVNSVKYTRTRTQLESAILQNELKPCNCRIATVLTTLQEPKRNITLCELRQKALNLSNDGVVELWLKIKAH